MTRPLRIEFPGAVYHVTARGNARESIYTANEDRREFLAILQEVVARFNWLCHAYCLMDNHYHLVIETPDGNLSRGMRHLNGVYTQRFNRKHSRVGHVFQGRYKAIIVERESYLLELCRYVVLNPVRAGVRKNIGRYAWSSYRATAGLRTEPPFLTVDWILGRFSGRRTEARKRYQHFVAEGVGGASPWQKLKAQCILGGREFIENLSPALKDKSNISEIPRRERYAYRPELEELLGADRVTQRGERNGAIVSAHRDYGYTLTEIARHLGLHYTTISKVVTAHLKTL